MEGANCRGLAWNEFGTSLAFLRESHSRDHTSIALYTVSLEDGYLRKHMSDVPVIGKLACGEAEGFGPSFRMQWVGYPGYIAFDYSCMAKASMTGQDASGPASPRTVVVQLDWRYTGSPGAQTVYGLSQPVISHDGRMWAVQSDFDPTNSYSNCVVYCDPWTESGRFTCHELVSTTSPGVGRLGYAIEGLALSPAGDRLAFITRFSKPGGVWVCAAAQSSTKPELARNADFPVGLTWTPDGRGLLIVNSWYHALERSPTTANLYVYAPATGQSRPLTAGRAVGDIRVGDQVWSQNGEWMLATEYRSDGIRRRLVLWDMTAGEVKQMMPSAPGIARLQPTASDPQRECAWRMDVSGRTRRMSDFEVWLHSCVRAVQPKQQKWITDLIRELPAEEPSPVSPQY